MTKASSSARLALSGLLLLIAACGRTAPPPAAPPPAAPVQEASDTATVLVVSDSSIRRLANYDFDAKAPLAARARPIPGFVLDYIRRLDDCPEYRDHALTAEERRLLAAYLALLPPSYQSVLRERLVAIYFVEGAKGGGLTEYVFDAQGDIYAIVILNPKVLHRGVSEWLTYKENSCFRSTDSGGRIAVDCGGKYRALIYVLLHEASHIVDYITKVTPFVEKDLLTLSGFKPGPREFVSGAWLDYDLPRPFYDDSRRRDVTFYGIDGPRLDDTDAPHLYSWLGRTPFVSLCASGNWADDFAEYVAFQHLTTALRQPYRIRYRFADGKDTEIEPLKLRVVQERLPIIRSVVYARTACASRRETDPGRYSTEKD